MTGTHNEIRCPKCDASIFVTLEQSGDKIKCPRCQNPILVPGKKSDSAKDVSVDDLIDLDDDIMHPNPDGQQIVAQSVAQTVDKSDDNSVDSSIDQAMKVTADAIDLTNDASADLSDDLQLAPDEQEPTRDATAETVKPEKPQDVSDSDDLGDLIDIPKTDPIKEEEDPFEVDEDADLVVDGVTPADGQFGVDCHLCGSLLYARVSQVGTKIKCHDCYSLVEVPEPTTEPTPVVQKESEKESDGYTLSDPYELETIDTSVDLSLPKIDYDDDKFFEKKRQMESGFVDKHADDSNANDDDDVISIEDAVDPESQPSEARTNKPAETKPAKSEPAENEATDAGDEYNLLPVPDKLPEKPVVAKPDAPISFGSGTNISDPVSVEPEPEPVARKPRPKSNSNSNSKGKSKPKPASEKKPARSADQKKTDPKKAAILDSEKADDVFVGSEDGLDYAGPFSQFGKWVSFALSPMKNVHGLVRWGMISLLAGGCYMVMAWGASFFDPEFNTAQKAGGFALVSLGAVPLMAVCFFLAIIGNSTTRIAIEQRGSLDEWPEFSIADWISQFLYLGTSFWIAAIPGVIFGSLIMFMTESSIWLFSLILISSLTLAPFFLSSVVFNESPWSLVTTDVFKSMGPLKNRWIRFLIMAFVIGVVIALAGLLIPFSFVCFLVAAVQVGLFLIYWWILGDLVGHVVRWLMEQSET